MSEPDSSAGIFAPVARKVRARVALRRWIALLGRTVWPVSIVLGLMILWALSGGVAIVVALWTAWLLWQVGGLIWSWMKRPGEFSALALWDSATGRREAFASAWWFETQGDATDTARHHMEKQKGVLDSAMGRLSQDLPLKPTRWLFLPFALVLLGTLVSAVRTPKEEILIVDDEMAAKAAESAQKLAKLDIDKKKLAGLDESEQQQIEELKAKVGQTAAELADAAGKDAKQVMAELERRARDAEKLADDLAKAREDWASDKLVDELRKHADTADLGDAVAAKDSQAAAKAADQLASELKSPQLSDAARKRLEETLDDAKKQAEEADRKRMVGQNVLNAADQMQKGDAKAAGAEFQQLADKMRDMALREQAQKELQQLAQQLRDAGSNMAGQNESGAMQEIGQAGQSGQGDSSKSAPQVGQTPSGQQQQQMLAPPGLGQQGQQNQMQQGQQGQGQQQQQQGQMMMGQQGQPQPQNGQGQPQQGQQPMLIAPVPGQGQPKPDSNGPVMILPGESKEGGATIALSGGGKEAGNGTAELNNTPTEKQGTERQDMVQAQQNAEGQSAVRSVEGGARTEQSARTATQVTLDALQAEEAALDESALPPARREQVRRYFNELRKRFEGGAK